MSSYRATSDPNRRGRSVGRRPRNVLVAALSLALLSAGHPGVARADSAAADALFKDAKALASQKKYEEACPKFEASYKLDKAVGTLMNLADCHENVGRVASAWAEWGEAFEWLKRDGDKRESFAAARRDALEPRLSRLTIVVTNPSPKLSVFRDSTLIEEGAYNAALPIDPGPHSITVRRGDEVLKEQRVDIAERAADSVSFDLAAIEKAAPPPKPGGGAAVGGGVVVAPKSQQKAIGFAVGGVGVAAFVTAAALEVGAMSIAGGLDEPGNCVKTYCSPQGLDRANRAGTFADVGQWVGIGGILLVGVGLTMVLTAPAPAAPSSSPDALPSTRARRSAPRVEAFITPYAGPLGGGVTVGGRL